MSINHNGTIFVKALASDGAVVTHVAVLREDGSTKMACSSVREVTVLDDRSDITCKTCKSLNRVLRLWV